MVFCMNELSEFLKTISDETRLRILALLFKKELCVCEICDVLEESQPKVSRHLAKLRDAGFVRDDRQGQWVFYYVNFNNEGFTEIMKTIINRIEEYPKLKKDLKKLTIKVSGDNLCKRAQQGKEGK